MAAVDWRIEVLQHSAKTKENADMNMRSLFGFIGLSAGGWVGWWLGTFVGMTTAVVLSSIFSGVGLWAARWVGREFME